MDKLKDVVLCIYCLAYSYIHLQFIKDSGLVVVLLVVGG